MSKRKRISVLYFKKIQMEVGWGEVLKILGIKTKRRSNPSSGTGDYITLCVFHKEKKASLHFFDNSGQYHCYGCGRHGDIFDFVSQYAFKGNKIRTYCWFKKNFQIPLPWELEDRNKKS